MTQEEMQEKLLDLQEKFKIMEEENKQLKTQIEEKTNREKELQEYNQKLFLRLSSEVKKEKEEEEVPFMIDEKLYKLLSDKEKETLKDLIEEE